MNKILIISGMIILLLGLFACTSAPQPTSDNLFEKLSDTSCSIDGKPIIRYYSTSWCPHCKYINPVWDEIVLEYGDKIIARHYEVDLQTPSDEEMAEFNLFSPNGAIPAFSFGCQYYRIGNSYEASGNIAAEKTEFERIINLLIS